MSARGSTYKIWPYFSGDPKFKSLSLAAKGGFVDLWCLMHENDRYKLTIPPKGLARILGITLQEFEEIMTEIEEKSVMKKNSDGIFYWSPPWNGPRVMDVSLSQWKRLRKFVFTRDEYVCRYCGSELLDPECDHVFPFSRGGLSVPDNLVTSCKPCNRSKRDKTVEEWRASL